MDFHDFCQSLNLFELLMWSFSIQEPLLSSISQTATVKTVTNKTDITTQNFLKFLVPANPAVVERVSIRSRLKRGQETAVASLGLRGKRRIKRGT